MPLTIEQMVAEVERMMRESCEKAGANYEEFLAKLDTLLPEGE